MQRNDISQGDHGQTGMLSHSAAVNDGPPKTTSSHRLPAVSASDALDDFESDGPSHLSTSLTAFDAILAPSATPNGGFERGKVHEVWGPSGAGKTALILGIAVKTLKDDAATVWVDGATPLSKSRLLAAANGTSINKLRHFRISALSHLLALLLYPLPGFPPPKTRLLVIENLNGLVDLDYPRFQAGGSAKSDHQKWLATRRYATLGSIVTALSKLAVVHNLAVVVTTGTASRMRSDTGLAAALVPGIGGSDWDSGVWSRVVVFRDFNSRFIGTQKAQGRSLISKLEVGEAGRTVDFVVGSDGLASERPKIGSEEPRPQQVVVRTPAKPRKRLYDEVADSEEEDEYGWLEGDNEALVAGEVHGPPTINTAKVVINLES